MKSLIIFTLSFLLAFPPQVFALSQDQQNRMKEFLEISEITKREVPLRELYGKFESALSEEVRAPFREYVTLNPNAVLPKFSISKVLGENGEQDIQLSFGTKGKGSGSVRLIGQGKVAAQAGEVKISISDLENPFAVIAKMEQAFPEAQFSKPQIKAKNFGLLSAKQVNSLSHDEKRLYFRSLQQLLAAMENVETSQLEVKSKRTSSHDYFFSALLPMAWAASKHNNEAVKSIKVNDNRNSCIYAGHVTNYGYKIEGATVQASDRVAGHYSCGGDSSSFRVENHRCKSKPGQIQCNADVYGADPEICVQEKSLNATAKCNEASTQYDAFPKEGINDKKGFDGLKQKIVAKLKAQEVTCEQVVKDPKLRLEDQGATCLSLMTRINEIKAVTCEGLAQNKPQRFNDLKCSVQGGSGGATGGSAGPPTGPATGGGAGPGTPADLSKCGADSQGTGKCPPAGTGGSTGPATGGSGGATNPPTDAAKCDPTLYSKNKDFIDAVEKDCSNSGGRVLSCPDETAERKMWVQCQCGSLRSGGRHGSTNLTYFCEKPQTSGTTSSSSKSTIKKKFDWIPVGLAALVIGLMAIRDKSVEKNTKALTPSPVAPTAESTTLQPNFRGAK